jgi:hypothetical protein
VPWRKQFLVNVDIQHLRVLNANDGTYFGFKFGPTTLLQHLRPDGLGLSPLFPFLTFPRYRPVVIGDLDFDVLDWSTSIPASMPAIALLAVLGAWAVVRPSFARTRALTALRVPILGAAVGVVLVLAIAFVANRYLGDWIPLLALGGLAGLHVLLLRGEDPVRRRSATVLLGIAAAAAVFGLWANGALAVVYQRLYNPAAESARAGMLGAQYDVDALLGGAPRAVRFVDTLPEEPAGAGTTAVVGECAALYWSDGRDWLAVEGTPAGGWFRFRVRAEELTTGHWMPLLAWGPRRDEDVIGVRRRGEVIDVAFGKPARLNTVAWYQTTQPRRVPGGEFTMTVHVDRPLADVTAAIDGAAALRLFRVRGGIADGPIRIGRATPGRNLAPRFETTITPLPARAPLCERLLDRAP